jgi:hypothetical protein
VFGLLVKAERRRSAFNGHRDQRIHQRALRLVWRLLSAGLRERTNRQADPAVGFLRRSELGRQLSAPRST